MIVTLCYWFILLWDVPVIKENFAEAATIELGIELTCLLLFSPIIIDVWKTK